MSVFSFSVNLGRRAGLVPQDPLGERSPSVPVAVRPGQALPQRSRQGKRRPPREEGGGRRKGLGGALPRGTVDSGQFDIQKFVYGGRGDRDSH